MEEESGDLEADGRPALVGTDADPRSSDGPAPAAGIGRLVGAGATRRGALGAATAVAIAVGLVSVKRAAQPPGVLPPTPVLRPAAPRALPPGTGHGEGSSAGHRAWPRAPIGSAADVVVRSVLALHAHEDNPRNRQQLAYTDAPPEELSSGQVGIRAISEDAILFYQYAVIGGALRTYSVRIDR